MPKITELKSFSYSALAKEENKIYFAKEIVKEFQEVGFLRL
jgi:hypothetical protein